VEEVGIKGNTNTIMKKFGVDSILWLLLSFFIVLTIVVYFTYDIWAVQVLSACLGAIITIIATRLLLSSQSKIEEQRRDAEDDAKRRFEIYNAKLKVYSDFVSKMYDILSDNKIDENEILDLRTRIFGQVSFYANGDILESINNELKNVENYRDTAKMQRIFANIASILQRDLRKDWPVNVQSAYNLWDTFDGLLDNSVSSEAVITNKKEENISNGVVTTETTLSEEKIIGINKGFWHFAMWGAEEQINALRKGVYELNLVEYEEDWRTNLIKQVQKDDLIFLFRSGGWGYMGVYRAVGWRIFEFGENGACKETVNYFNEGTKEITDNCQIEKDLEQSDIYRSREDGADLCSSIIVEPLAFSRYGIGNPGGVYRRTISRYDRGYGLMQLARFMAIMDDETVYDIHDNGESKAKMGCNKELFKRILANGNIKPTARDKDGNWM
jgi:hypothetical protein